jgi:hypothetical protein
MITVPVGEGRDDILGCNFNFIHILPFFSASSSVFPIQIILGFLIVEGI